MAQSRLAGICRGRSLLTYLSCTCSTMLVAGDELDPMLNPAAGTGKVSYVKGKWGQRQGRGAS